MEDKLYELFELLIYIMLRKIFTKTPNKLSLDLIFVYPLTFIIFERYFITNARFSSNACSVPASNPVAP